jgi:PHP family Zn ribbon phosphoesterase
MKFIADLHVHSRHSRATAKNLDLENLYIAGQLKGITVLGTGDVTHPVWFSMLGSKSGFDSIQKGGVCPVCSKPLTLGVLYRVE